METIQTEPVVVTDGTITSIVCGGEHVSYELDGTPRVPFDPIQDRLNRLEDIQERILHDIAVLIGNTTLLRNQVACLMTDNAVLFENFTKVGPKVDQLVENVNNFVNRFSVIDS
jgi:hypothetical protein